jgi:hypothetical protein
MTSEASHSRSAAKPWLDREALPAFVTVALAVGVVRMSRRPTGPRR